MLESRQIAERAITTRLPIVYGSRAFPEAAGLILYGVDRRHLYRRAAEYVDMILKGRTPHGTSKGWFMVRGGDPVLARVVNVALGGGYSGSRTWSLER